MQYGNLAYQEEPRCELIAGTLVAMSPSPTVNHGQIIENLHLIFGPYLKGKIWRVFLDNVDLHLSEDDRFIPDFMIVCDPTKIKEKGIYGAPDLIVEILSPSTRRNDKGIKKDTYARTGVNEYWIINPTDKTIEQYYLEDGSYVLQDIYGIYTDSELDGMTDEQIEEIATHFQCHMFDDLDISVRDVFDDMI